MMETQDIKTALASDFWIEVKSYINSKQEELKSDILSIDLTIDANKNKAIKLQAEYESFRKLKNEIALMAEGLN